MTVSHSIRARTQNLPNLIGVQSGPKTAAGLFFPFAPLRGRLEWRRSTSLNVEAPVLSFRVAFRAKAEAS